MAERPEAAWASRDVAWASQPGPGCNAVPGAPCPIDSRGPDVVEKGAVFAQPTKKLHIGLNWILNIGDMGNTKNEKF